MVAASPVRRCRDSAPGLLIPCSEAPGYPEHRYRNDRGFCLAPGRAGPVRVSIRHINELQPVHQRHSVRLRDLVVNSYRAIGAGGKVESTQPVPPA